MDLDDLRFDDRDAPGTKFKKHNVLTPKARNACELYLKGKSIKQAMLSAGYAKSYVEGPVACMRFFKNRCVVDYIRQRQEELSKANAIDQSKLIKYAEHILDDDDSRDRTKALELLMRMVTNLPENIKNEDIKQITINIEQAKPD